MNDSYFRIFLCFLTLFFVLSPNAIFAADVSISLASSTGSFGSNASQVLFSPLVHLLLTGGVIQLYRLIFLDPLHSVVNDLGTNFHDLSDLSGMLDRMSHHSDIFVSTTLRMTGYIIVRVMVCSMDSRTPIILVVSILRVFDWNVLTRLFHQLSRLVRIFHIITPAIFL